MALREDGTAVAWGHQTYGTGAVPAGLANVVAIACGSFHNLALVREGDPAP